MALTTDIKGIAGLLPVSMVDWEGKLASVIFLRGCNLRCPYCHNPELVRPGGAGQIGWDAVEAQLSEKIGWIDGVVITGGEPTICSDITELIKRIGALGLPVKLDTNGTRPNILRALLEQGGIECVAMDFKAPFDAYEAVVRPDRAGGPAAPLGDRDELALTLVEPAIPDAVRESIDIIVGSGVDHEFRTTVVPGYCDLGDLVGMARYLGEHGADRYYLQQYKPGPVLEPNLEAVRPFPAAAVDEAARACEEFLPTKVRGNS